MNEVSCYQATNHLKGEPLNTNDIENTEAAKNFLWGYLCPVSKDLVIHHMDEIENDGLKEISIRITIGFRYH
jgi:hypothetical protein